MDEDRKEIRRLMAVVEQALAPLLKENLFDAIQTPKFFVCKVHGQQVVFWHVGSGDYEGYIQPGSAMKT